jgi:hypothetical protein
MIIESREAVGQVAKYLAEKYGVEFHWNTAISRIEHPKVISGKSWEADEILFAAVPILKRFTPNCLLKQISPNASCK